jgi:hypothetical protein
MALYSACSSLSFDRVHWTEAVDMHREKYWAKEIFSTPAQLEKSAETCALCKLFHNALVDGSPGERGPLEGVLLIFYDKEVITKNDLALSPRRLSVQDAKKKAKLGFDVTILEGMSHQLSFHDRSSVFKRCRVILSEDIKFVFSN